MGYWVNTTYLNHGSVEEVAGAIAALCSAEGMAPIAAPAQRKRLAVEPMQYDSALNNDLWGLAIFPGAPSWMVVQTAPLELLAQRAAGAPRMRLADLCTRLSAPAFQLHVYDTTGTILVEVSATGEVALSGFNLDSAGSDPLAWHGERLSEGAFEARFRLHPFQDVIAGAALGDEKAERIARRFGGENARFCDNAVSVDTLISHKPFTAKGGSALYFKWPGASRCRFYAAESWDEYRSAMAGK